MNENKSAGDDVTDLAVPGHRDVIDLGPETALQNLPVRIVINSEPYYLVRNSGYQLLSTVCPHMAGEVVDNGSCFECRHHGWRFDRLTGIGLNATGARLVAHPVSVKDGRLIAHFSSSDVEMRVARGAGTLPAHLKIKLHAHACLEIVHRGFSLITDPWLTGPAFLGAWMPYPPMAVDATKLRPDAIWISHEHSDHFHEPTLRQFARTTPMYVSDFPNRRMVNRLHAMGFVNVTAMRFGQTYEIHANLTITCFEPASSWNDAIALCDIEGFRLLVLNDAGLNRRIATMIGRVDAVATSFSTGSSGYPLTWTHLSSEQKTHLLERTWEGRIGLIKEAMRLYGARYLIPYAAHFGLWHPAHHQYAASMKRLTLDDVVEAFAESDIDVIDLMPGESWAAATGGFERRWRQRKKLYERPNELQLLNRNFQQSVFDMHHPEDAELSTDEIERYFLSLNDVPEIMFCEDLRVKVSTTKGFGGSPASETILDVANGELRLAGSVGPAPNLTIHMPRAVLACVIRDGLSWDEAHIGYWCTFTRNPDVYHSGFWRLLQAPYFRRPLGQVAERTSQITESTIIADVVERYGPQADRLLGRYGLYCVGCHHSASDSLATGAMAHGVNAHQLAHLIAELQMLSRRPDPMPPSDEAGGWTREREMF